MDRALETVQLFGSLLVTLLALFVPITIGIALLRRVVGPERLQRWLGGRRLSVAVLKGTALGAVTPFCGCSTIPLLVGLIKADVRFAAVAAFTLASPLLNPYILGVVALLFGWQTTVAYAGFAVATTVILAVLWETTGLHRHLKIPGYRPASSVPAPTDAEVRAREPVGAGCAASTGGADTPSCGGSEPGGGCDGSAAGAGDDDGAERSQHLPWQGARVELRSAWEETRGLLRPMMVPLVLGLGIGAVIYGAVPQGAFAQVLGSSNWLTLPVAALLGLPLYLRGEAAFPIGAGLLAAGVGEGPMFAMVIAGMGASLPEVTILASIFQRRLLLVFLGSVFTMAIVGGALIPLWS